MFNEGDQFFEGFCEGEDAFHQGVNPYESPMDKNPYCDGYAAGWMKAANDWIHLSKMAKEDD